MATKEIYKAYKFRLYPTKEQQEKIDATLRAHQFVYNRYRALRKNTYENTLPILKRPVITGKDKYDRDIFERDEKGKIVYEEYKNPYYSQEAANKIASMTPNELKKYLKTDKGAWLKNHVAWNNSMCSTDLTEFKKTEEGAWLNDFEADAFGWTLRNLDTAYQNFFRMTKRGQNKGYPKFKNKKHPLRAYTTRSAQLIKDTDVNDPKIKKITNVKPQNKTFNINTTNKNENWKWVFISKIGFVKIVLHQPPLGVIKHSTISKTPSGQYYISFSCDEAPYTSFPALVDDPVGMDVGIATWATLSDGTTFENPKNYNKCQKRKRKLQRQLSRKKVGSANYKKQTAKLAKLDQHIANQRRYATQNMTTELIRRYNTIIVEGLDVQNMMQEKAEYNCIKRNIARAIADANFFEIRRELEYKADWADRNIVVLDNDCPTTQTCSNCGAKTGPKGLKQLNIREWTCPDCGATHQRCENNAQNIFDAGLQIIANSEEK